MGSVLEPPLTSLKVTHVFYDPSDPLSLLFAYMALIPQGLMVIYVTLIYARREIEVVLMLVGQLLSEATNWVLKRLIKEDRPPRSQLKITLTNERYRRGRIWNAQFSFTVYGVFCHLCDVIFTASVL